MRSNSGDDEGRNNVRDPTLRDRNLGRDKTAQPASGKTKAPADNRQGRKD